MPAAVEAVELGVGEAQVLEQEVERPHQLGQAEVRVVALPLSPEVAAEQVQAAVAPAVVLVVVPVAEAEEAEEAGAEEAGVGEAVADRPAPYLRLLHCSLPIPTINACYAGLDCLKQLVGR